jgi:hypothetical protein
MDAPDTMTHMTHGPAQSRIQLTNGHTRTHRHSQLPTHRYSQLSDTPNSQILPTHRYTQLTDTADSRKRPINGHSETKGSAVNMEMRHMI